VVAGAILEHVSGPDHPLEQEAQTVVEGDGMSFKVRTRGGGFGVDIVRRDGSVVWPDYASGPDPLLTVLSAEQRYLVEERGTGSVHGETYLDKARQRLRRWTESQP
jgi:hypothetical protein